MPLAINKPPALNPQPAAPKPKTWHYVLIVLLFLGGILLVLTIYAVVTAGFSIKQSLLLQTASSTTAITHPYSRNQLDLLQGSDYQWLGASSTPQLTIVEFGDFACPFCLASYAGEKQMLEKYKTKVKLIWRDQPRHDYSVVLALGAYCAGEQGKFWPMADLLFANQSDTLGSNITDLFKLADQLGIDNSQYQDCVNNQKYLNKIRFNFGDSQQLGVSGTPTWFFNGNIVEGQLTADQLEKLILSYIKN